LLEWNTESDYSSNSALSTAIELIKSKKYTEAAALCETAVQSNDFRAKSLALQGSFQFIKGDMKSAYESLTLSNQLDSNDSNVLIRLALVELEKNNYLKMNENLEKAHDADPKNPALFYHRGEIFALGGNLELSVMDFEKAIDLYPDFVLAYIHKARALLGLERYSDAEISINQAKEKFNDRVDVLNSVGEVLVLKKEFDAAENIFDSILKKYPKSPEVYLNKALLSMSRNNDVKAAEKYLKRAIEIEPSFEAAHLQLANLLLSNGNVKDSMAHFEHAVKYARTLQELISVHSLKCASIAQLRIAEKFPSLAEKMK
jgi:mitochondrial import receptor subunit TOM70